MGLQTAIAVALKIVAIAMAVYQLLYTQILIQDPDGHLITHLGLALVVVLLPFLLRSKGRQLYLALALLLLSLVITGYLRIELDDI